MFSHKCEHWGSDFQVFYVSYSSTDSNISVDFEHLKMWSWRRTGDVNWKVTLQHCRVPLWLVPHFFGSCPDLWSPSSPSSLSSGDTAFLPEPEGSGPCPLLTHLTGTVSYIQWQRDISVLFHVLILKILDVTTFKVSSIRCRAWGDTQKGTQQGVLHSGLHLPI